MRPIVDSVDNLSYKKMYLSINRTIRNIAFYRYINIAVAAVCLILGGLIYMTFRTQSLQMFEWLESLHLMPMVQGLRVSYSHMEFPDWVLYNLPDGLWLLSYMLVIGTIWHKDNNIYATFFLWMLPGLAIGSELLQLFKIIPGTFDVLDLLSYALAMLIYKLIAIFEISREDQH